MQFSPVDSALEAAIGAMRAAAEAADLEREPDRAIALFDLALKAKALRAPEIVAYLEQRALRRAGART